MDRLCNQARGQNTAVTWFYFDFAARKEQSAINMLGSLVKQMVSGMERIPDEISTAFREQKKTIGGCGPELIDLVNMLYIITSTRPTFMCIDALDECVSVQRVKVLDSLKQILDRSPATRIFVTGRPHIQAEMEKRLAGRVVRVSVCPTKGDIIGYLWVRLGEDETPDAMNASLEAETLEKIPENISEMYEELCSKSHPALFANRCVRFLLVSLNIDLILQESTIYRRRERLKKITDGLRLGDAYGATIERIKAQGVGKSRLGMEALMWISNAERPLSADELCHALAVELGSTDFHAENVPSASTLVNSCQGLITLDKEASTVRLIHFTLKEYLSAHSIFSSPHSGMAEICLTYLNSGCVKALSAASSSHILDTPFLGYCSLYWGVHAKRELSDHARSLAVLLFQEYDSHISAKLFLAQAVGISLEYLGTSFRFSGLHCASFLGIEAIVAALIEVESYDINEEDLFGHTPLARAAENGHERVVKILLGRKEVNLDKPNMWGSTPLLYAARNGHAGVVKVLLEREEVSSNKPNDLGNKLLSDAAQRGHEDMVKILLEREDVDPDKLDDSGNTPLLHAAMNGHEGVVKILLGQEEVNPNKPNDHGNGPLSLAANNGHEDVVKMLLASEEVNRDMPDVDGQTPLACAAFHGYAGVVKILLEQEGVNPNKPDHDGRTPFSIATQQGYVVVVKIFLDHEEVISNKRNNHGSTPLSLAAERGHEDVVKIVLAREEVNPETLDDDGDTPLACAALGGCEGVVKILLEQEGVSPDKPNHAGQTPLSIAAQHGHVGVIKILLDQKEVNSSKADNDGQTPLMHATRRGYKRVVKLLRPPKALTRNTLLSLRDTTPQKRPPIPPS